MCVCLLIRDVDGAILGVGAGGRLARDNISESTTQTTTSALLLLPFQVDSDSMQLRGSLKLCESIVMTMVDGCDDGDDDNNDDNSNTIVILKPFILLITWTLIIRCDACVHERWWSDGNDTSFIMVQV